MLFYNSRFIIFAHEEKKIYKQENFEGGLESYSGYGCNNGVDLQVNQSEHTENYTLESIVGFGCGSLCGASREDGYSSNYHSGCRNWQVMPVISPMFKYWIDESTLSSLTKPEKDQFIADVDDAAAEWNSVRISDYQDEIVNLQKMSSNGIDVVPIRYNPSLSGCLGKFNPVPLFHYIEIKNLNDPQTILHEFGHMIGLQDLDCGKDPVDFSHISLMGYAGNDKLHYQDIQGLAVANNKHTNHDFRKFWRDGEWYNYVCFYCDITDSVLTSQTYGTQLANGSSCLHTYEMLVSAGSRYWQKCTNCYKVIESEFTVNVKDSKSVEITGLIDNRTTIIIPRQIGGQNVTNIGDAAFSDHTNITSITFEATSNVNMIGDSAFKGCASLGSIVIPNTVTNIGPNAFNNCSSLSIVTLPNNLTSISNSLFNGCSTLTSITIPSSVTSIGFKAFQDCCSLTNLTIPSSVTNIGSEAFRYCTSLTTITIPKTVTSIGSNVFYGCSLSITWNYNPALSAYNFRDYLSSVVVGNNVTSISNYAFKDCPNLTSINISNSVKSIAYGAFWGCSRLTNITIPNSVTYLGEAIFRDCSRLTNVTLPNGLTTINDTTFWGCSSLSSIIIPDSVTSIGNGAFSGCSSLTSIVIPDGVSNINVETFSYCTSLSTITIGSNIESIGHNAFRYCSNLNEVVIPESVTYIGFEAFAYCSNLDTVYIEREYPSITALGDYAFYGCDPNIRIYVPYYSLIYYRGANNWSDYSSRIIIEGQIPECGFEQYFNHTLTSNIDSGDFDYYIIWVVDPGNYQISFNSTSAFQIEFYDEDVNLVNVTLVTDPSNLSGYFDYEVDYSSYMYYLVVKFVDPLISGTIVTTVEWLN